MKKYMRILTGALALLMCVGVFASCKKKDDDATEDTSQVTTAGGDETTSNVDAKGYLLDDLGDKDFGGKEIKILTWINKSYSLNLTPKRATIPTSLKKRCSTGMSRSHAG